MAPAGLTEVRAAPAVQCGRAAGVRRRREPERTVLHEVVRGHLQTFLAEARERSEGAGLPRFVEREFERYLDCGILAHGFARVRCGGCKHEFLVAFSCKNRGVCPSCSARRMHDTAAHLVDAVFPRVSVRQWVLSLPRWARWLLARDAPLASRALAIALRAIFAHYRRLERKGRCGAVTFIQRFGGSLNLNLHFHCAVPDGVFVRDETGVLFVPARPPTDEEVHKVLLRIARKLRGLLLPKQPEDPIDALDAGYAESVQSMQMTGLADPPRPRRCSAFIEGFSLHAGVHLHANDREGLEHLLAYGARGPISLERLSTLLDGRICYRLKRPLPDGRCELFFTPTEFLRKLSMLIPPPRRHLVRFHGLFAPNSGWRKQIVPACPTPVSPSAEHEPPGRPEPDRSPRAPGRIPWAELFRRVFRINVLQCERCGGEMKVLALVTEQAAIKKILEHLDLPSTGPPIAKARRPPEFDFVA